MSEANASFNPQDQSASSNSSSVPKKKSAKRAKKDAEWEDVWAEPPHLENHTSKNHTAKNSKAAPLSADQIFDASALDEAVFEDPSAVSSDCQIAASSSMSANLSSIAAWSQETPNPAELPNLADLITLIQELNQCNGALLDRVSQLEEDLEHSQNALQAEVGRTQDHRHPLQGDSLQDSQFPNFQPQDLQSVNAQDWTMVQEQITTLFNQLEFAHQTNQRQQILIETLTGQLENGQERVAQLEREAALLQQRYNEQTQLLSKSEGTCRDLQARLQRQQRYTLQFKAALEKSLEMPTPQYEMGLASETPETPMPLAPISFLPKAQRIQPWSAHTQIASMKSSWMKLQHLDLEVGATEPTVAQQFQDSSTRESIPQPSKAFDAPLEVPAPAPQIDLPSFGVPLPQQMEDQLASADPSLADPVLEEQVHRLTTDPALRQHLDAAVKPLADMLAEALLADQVSEAELNGNVLENASPSADELLASTMADAEDALWQDLARLIDVSAEDVVKASLSGDLAAFESISFAEQLEQVERVETTTPEPDLANSSAVNHDASTIAPLIRRIGQTGIAPTVTEQSAPNPPAPKSQPQPAPQLTQPAQTQETMPTLAHSSWPSPVVYPLRSTKKRQSLAMVDLPTFPKGES